MFSEKDKVYHLLRKSSMAIIVDGKSIADGILKGLKAQVGKNKRQPRLAVVLVGQDPASFTYVRKKEEAALGIGMHFSLFHYPASIGTDGLVKELRRIQKTSWDGIIVQLPLPKTINKAIVLNELNSTVDVDFLSWESLGKLVIGENDLIPPTPGAILEILKQHKIKLNGQHVVMVGAGNLIGKPLANILVHEPITLTICSKSSKNLDKLTRQADILITGTGVAELINGNMVKKGAVVIDAGVSFRGKKMFGDIHFASVSKKAGIVTPTPGGVGPVTVAKLLENVVKNSQKK